MPGPDVPRIREARLTLGLVAICVLWFFWTFALALNETGASGLLPSLWNLGSREALARSGGLVLTRVWLDGEWWRVLTAGFVHGSWLHLGLNTWALLDVGRWTERALGARVLLAVFLLSSVGGCLASLAWVEAQLVVGASAGIFGLASALVVVRRFGNSALVETLAPISSGRLGFWLVLWLVVGWQLPMLANAGHLGGAVVGVLAGFALVGRTAAWRWLAWAATGAVIVSLALVGRAPAFRPNYDLFTGLALLQRGEASAGLERVERAFARAEPSPGDQNNVAYELALQGVALDRAEALSLASLAASPEEPSFLDTLGWIYCRMGRVEDGLRQLEASVAASTVPDPEVAAHIAGCGSAAID